MRHECVILDGDGEGLASQKECFPTPKSKATRGGHYDHTSSKQTASNFRPKPLTGI